jgi:hypothetical protein
VFVSRRSRYPPSKGASPLSATALRPFRLVCRNRRQFGSRAAMNVSRRPFCVQTACRRSDQDPGSAGADLWRRRGVALFDSRYGRVPPVVSRRFRKNWVRTPVDKSLARRSRWGHGGRSRRCSDFWGDGPCSRQCKRASIAARASTVAAFHSALFKALFAASRSRRIFSRGAASLINRSSVEGGYSSGHLANARRITVTVSNPFAWPTPLQLSLQDPIFGSQVFRCAKAIPGPGSR